MVLTACVTRLISCLQTLPGWDELSLSSLMISGDLRAAAKHKAKCSGDIFVSLMSADSSVVEPDLNITIIDKRYSIYTDSWVINVYIGSQTGSGSTPVDLERSDQVMCSCPVPWQQGAEWQVTHEWSPQWRPCTEKTLQDIYHRQIKYCDYTYIILAVCTSSSKKITW